MANRLGLDAIGVVLIVAVWTAAHYSRRALKALGV